MRRTTPAWAVSEVVLLITILGILLIIPVAISVPNFKEATPTAMASIITEPIIPVFVILEITINAEEEEAVAQGEQTSCVYVQMAQTRNTMIHSPIASSKILAKSHPIPSLTVTRIRLTK